MSTPNPDENGRRRYGQWAGNERGVPEVAGYCIEEIWPADSFVPRQCGRLHGHGPDGLYCKQHGKRAARLADGA